MTIFKYSRATNKKRGHFQDLPNDKEEKERVEKAYRELISDYVYIDEREGAMYENIMRDPWESTFQYVAEAGFHATKKHDELDADEAYEYLKKWWAWLRGY